MCKITKCEYDTMLSNCYLFSAYHVNGGIPTMGMAEIITEIYILLVGYGEPAIMSGCLSSKLQG